MEVLLALVFAFLVLLCFCKASSRTEDATMNAILAKEWYWVVRHTWIQTDSGKILINERIDAAYVTFMSEAVAYARQRHPLKANMALTAFACRNADERFVARELHDMVSRRIADFEGEMQQLEQRMY